MVIVVFLELDVADGDPVSVQGNHLEKIIFYFQKFACHHLVAVIRGYGKNSLTNCFFQGKLCQTDVLVPFDVRKIRKFLTIAALDIEYCIFAFDHSIETIVRRNGDRSISIWQFSNNFIKKLCFQRNFASFQDRTFYFCLNSQFHIISGQLDLACIGINENTFED